MNGTSGGSFPPAARPVGARPLVSLEDLSIEFTEKSGFFRSGGSVKAVTEANLEIRPGETLGLVGESGSGKTTLGRATLRLIEPTRGRVLFEGRDLAEMPEEELRGLRRRMQIVFQDPNSSLNPRRRVEDIVGDALRIHGERNRAAIREKVVAILDAVGLSADDLGKFPHQFSGGQKQRIGIARALILDPRYVVLDEPVSALDVSIQAQILELLRELRAKRSLTYLFVAHDIGVVAHIADRVAVMYLGRIVELGNDVIRDPRHPYTRALVASAPRLDPAAPEKRETLKGDPPSPMNPPSGCVFRTRCPIAEPRCAAEVPKLVGGVACHLAR